jgi:hypothetical protein
MIATFESLNQSMNRLFFMKLLGICLLIFAFTAIVILPEVLGHAPLGAGGNESLATAALVPDPTKS